jgi:type VI secretion system protein ImpM
MDEPQVGFFGKVPQLGDFVERGVHPGFLCVWDQWLQEGVAASRETLAESWLDVYLTSPAWRFAIAPGVCGDGGYAGVLVPSVDRVGRYFPLTIVAALPPNAPVLTLLARGGAWFQHVESAMREQLESDTSDIEHFEQEVESLRPELTEILAVIGTVQSLQTSVNGWILPLTSLDAIQHSLLDLVDPLLTVVAGPVTAWFTDGSPRVTTMGFISNRLPPAATYRAMLDGNFDLAQWHRLVPTVATSPREFAERTFRFDCAIRTDAGHVRLHNEDGAWGDAARGVWVVADGMGGHSGGARASASICAAFAAAKWSGNLERRVARAMQILSDVNSQLRPQTTNAGMEIEAASTVVVLLVTAGSFACLWAGDSRLYRCRDSVLDLLTSDHSSGVRAAGDEAHQYFVTAGIGVADDVAIDRIDGEVQSGDCFLLCTDGVYESLSVKTLAEALSENGAEKIADRLRDSVLEGPASDNLTVAIVSVADSEQVKR